MRAAFCAFLALRSARTQSTLTVLCLRKSQKSSPPRVPQGLASVYLLYFFLNLA